MTRWEKKELRLRDDHRWRAQPGNQVLVLDRGAVSLEVPRGWVVRPQGTAIAVTDREPPDDDMRLQVSVIHAPSMIDWTGLPLVTLFAEVARDPDAGVIGERTPIAAAITTDYEYAWDEVAYTDEQQRRPARSRTCIARGRGVHAVITLDFWADDDATARRVWKGALRSLRLGESIADPTVGPERRRPGGS